MSNSRLSILAPSFLSLVALVTACSPPEAGQGEPSKSGSGGADIGGGLIDDPFDENQEAPPGCGDGQLTEDEACDDGNLDDGDGCAGNCLAVDPGFICREEGQACEAYAKCGDGILSFPEQCDFGDETPGDGCSATCKVEVGWKCDDAGCSATVCGDGVREGAELCDDSNSFPFDGCSIDCQIEPTCTAGAGCVSTCGDGIVLGEEQCDDANTIDGDGCSSTCMKEPGYDCTGQPCEMVAGACVLRVPMVLRDFSSSHPDFGFYGGPGPGAAGGNNTGMVAAQLDAMGKPVPASPGSVTDLANWYRDSSASTGPFLGSVLLFDDGNNNFVNRYQDDGTRWEVPLGAPSCQSGDNGGAPCPVDGNPLFFPLDGITPAAEATTYDAEAPQPLYGGFNLTSNTFPDHNFHFTTEVAYWFVYNPAANATLTFVGDDDVWVFINGILAVDIGNKHEPKGGRITLGETTATVGYSTDQQFKQWDESTRPISDFALTAGAVYEIKVFHAERETRSSSFQLTLGGFDTSRSECSPDCGDGIIGIGEECDDGVNDGGYNECQAGCVLGGYCGDGIKQEGEQCDDRDPEAPSGCRGCRVLVVK